MHDFFAIKEQLENQGYSNIELMGGGSFIVATSSKNEVTLFDMDLNIVPFSEKKRVENIKDKVYKIIINSVETEYIINE